MTTTLKLDFNDELKGVADRRETPQKAPRLFVFLGPVPLEGHFSPRYLATAWLRDCTCSFS